MLKTIVSLLSLAFLGSLASPSWTLSPQPSNNPSQPAVEERDGQHDFDFNFGVWHTHIRRIVDPFDPSSGAIELNGTVSVRKVWGGKAQLEEIEADGPKGHWEGLSLFLYNPQSRQWSQTFVNSKSGVVEGTPLIGSFKDGRCELFGQDSFHDKSILVRGVWSDIAAGSHRYEEAYSRDGGTTWHHSFRADLTRMKDAEPDTSTTLGAPPVTDSASAEGARDFDWDIGRWKIHMQRLSHPLTGSTSWFEMDGTTVNSKVWNGRANLAEVEADGPNGHLELLALRLYNPQTHEWTNNFATSGVGVLNAPLGVAIAGEFRNGRADFYDQETFNGRAILVRFSIWPVSADAAQSEQAFSADGGKTWETNWINKYARVKE